MPHDKNQITKSDDEQRDRTRDDPNRKPVGEGSAEALRTYQPDTTSGRFPGHWLCKFEVMVDLPSTLYPGEMEAAIADCLAVRLPALGFHGNCIVTLLSTADDGVLMNHPGNTRRRE